VSSLASLSEVGGSLVDTTAKANFRALGKRFGKRVQDVAKAVANADAAALSLALREGTASVEVDGETITLAPDEVIITETPREGWSVASDSGATVALDLEITEELRRAGLARDAIRLIQEARKNSGLDVADRIALRWTATDEAVVDALTGHAGLIADEVLATDFATGEADDTYGAPFTDEALTLTFRLRKA
jgi:isoleucyl-tRNA synthetase